MVLKNLLILLIPLFDNRNMDPQTCNLIKLNLILGAESNKFYPDLFKTATNSILAEGSFMKIKKLIIGHELSSA